jgi:hypothetical protein
VLLAICVMVLPPMAKDFPRALKILWGFDITNPHNSGHNYTLITIHLQHETVSAIGNNP